MGSFRNGKSEWKVLVIILITTTTSLAANLRPEQVAEPCTGNFITQDYNETWTDMIINSTVYFPLTSKYSMLLFSKNFYQTHEFETITEDQIKSSCMSSRNLMGTGNLTAYDGKSFLVLLAHTNVARLYRFNLGYPDVHSGAGYASIALSDSKTYNLLDFCFDNGVRSFAVVSTKKVLDDNTRNIISAHVKSLGFKEKNFLTLNYDKCTEKKGILTTSGNDLPKPSETHTLLVYRPTAFFTKKLASTSYFFKA